MGNTSSKGSGPVLQAEALSPLPRYGSLCAILGGVNRSEHQVLRVSLGMGGLSAGKYKVYDVKASAGSKKDVTLLKSEVKSTMKRTITTISSCVSGTQRVLQVEGTHECVGFRKGCIMSPRGIMDEDGGYYVPASPSALGSRGGSAHGQGTASPGGSSRTRVSHSTTGSTTGHGLGSTLASPGSPVYAINQRQQQNADVAFAARALDYNFWDWGIEFQNLGYHGMRSGANQHSDDPKSHLSIVHQSEKTATIWTEENRSTGTVDFSYEGQVVARVAMSPGGSILWGGEKYEIGKSSLGLIVTPGMDWVLVSTLVFLFLARKSEFDDAGINTRPGDLSLLSKLFEEATGDPAAFDRSTASIGTSGSGGGGGGSSIDGNSNKGSRRSSGGNAAVVGSGAAMGTGIPPGGGVVMMKKSSSGGAGYPYNARPRVDRVQEVDDES